MPDPTVTWKEYVDQRFAAADEAVAKAERTMNDRLNSMNEFRAALKDQSAMMATRSDVEKIDQAVRELQRAKANLDGRMVFLTGGISIVTTFVMWALSRAATGGGTP